MLANIETDDIFRCIFADVSRDKFTTFILIQIYNQLKKIAEIQILFEEKSKFVDCFKIISRRPKIKNCVSGYPTVPIFFAPTLNFLSIFRGFPRNFPVRPYCFPIFPCKNF